MNIRPSAAIRQNYNEIADMCRKTAEPIFLTKNGEGDLVVMDIETYNRREKMLKLREELLAVEEDRMHGSTGYSVGEVAAMSVVQSRRRQAWKNRIGIVLSCQNGRHRCLFLMLHFWRKSVQKRQKG